MRHSELKQLIKEELGRYMFFQNLKTIKQAVDEMLKLDEKMVDGILASGHDWAADHVATSKDDIEEVHSFLMSKKVAGPVGMDENEESKLKIGDKVKYENQEWEVIDIFRTGEVRLKHLKGLPSTNVMASKAIKIQEKKLSPKQMKIAKAAPPDDKITGADFAALRKGK